MKDFKYTTLLLSLAVILATGCGSTDEVINEVDNVLNNETENSCVEITGVIDKDTVWNHSCYTLKGSITVAKNKLLTIKEGSTITFPKNSYLAIEGALKAVGTAEKPIVFTGTTKSAGHWQGLQFSNSVDDRNELNHVVIEYAGSWNYGALYTADATTLKVKNTTIRRNKLNGFYFSNDTKLLEFTNVTSTENEKSAGSVSPNLLAVIGGDNDFSGNEDNYLTVRAGTVTFNQTWSALNVPLFIDRYFIIKENKLLTIEAGAKLEFANSGYIVINGALKAVGTSKLIDPTTGDVTPAKPIIFTGSTKSAGHWQGLQFKNAIDTRNELANVVLEYAGSWSYGALYTSGATSLKIRDTIIKDNKLYGFFFSDETKLIEFKNVTSTKNEKTAGSVHPNHLSIIDGTSDFTGNTDDYLTIRSGVVSFNQTWTPLSVPVFVDRFFTIKKDKLLTIKEGAKFEFTSSGYILVYGGLKAVGSKNSKILFSGSTKSKGFWQGIQFSNAVDSRNELAYMTLEYAGSWSYGAIVAGESTTLNLHDSLIQNNKLFGLWIDGSAKVTTKNNTFINNDDGDIHQD